MTAVPPSIVNANENIPPSLSVQHTKSVEGQELRGGKGRAAQRSPCAKEQKNSTFSLHSKVSPTSCSSYLVLAGTNHTSEQFNQQRPQVKFESPSSVMHSLKVGSCDGVQNYVPIVSQNQHSGFSVKPFSHLQLGAAEKDHFRTPEAMAPAAGLEDLKNQSGQANRKGNSCAFLWKSESQYNQKAAPAKPCPEFMNPEEPANPQQKIDVSENIREAFSAFSQLIKAPSSNESSDDSEAEISKLDQNAHQIKLGFSLLLKP